MSRSYWLVKSEPSTYSWSKLVDEKKAVWDGVRNFEARNNLRAMKKDDLVFFYHSNEGKAVVGVARVKREAYQDPTTKDDWSVVDLEPVKPLARPVTLEEMREMKALANMVVVKKSRLSVSPVTKDEFDAVLAAGKTKLK
jgi:predicted RNA-binding protein with PUA-like domain